MPIFQAGSINNTSLVVPDLYVEIVPPRNLIINGVPTNTVGVVGTASWGAVAVPVLAGSMAEYYACFGPIVPRKYDAGTQMATAVQQGAQDFRVVRVTDGTDTAASIHITATTVTISAKYTGSLGNNISVAMKAGSRPGTWTLIVALPGIQPEIFDNIAGDATTFWEALEASVNHGSSANRRPSQLITVTRNGNVSTPSEFALVVGDGTPGTDGASGVGSDQLVGTDGVLRSGMYALRGQNCGLLLLADADDPQTWVEQAAFGIDEGIYAILTGPAGDTISAAVSVKQAVGLESFAAKLMFGDWIWWADRTNGITRLVSPQGFAAGRLANLSPEQSSLNKPLFGVLGTQRSGQLINGQVTAYSSADLAELLGAGIDVIANPQPGGAFWGVRGGRNSSLDLSRNGDSYVRLTNYIARSLSSAMGQYVGLVIDDGLFRAIRGTLMSFLQNMLNQGLLGSTDGFLPFSVICDRTNNPASATALGYVQADVQVRYQAVNEKFIINLEGGQTVQIARQTLPNRQSAQ